MLILWDFWFHSAQTLLISFVASSLTHRSRRLFQTLHLIGINRPPLSLKRRPWSWSSTSMSSVACHQSFTSWSAEVLLSRAQLFAAPWTVAPPGNRLSHQGSSYILVWTSLLASWFFWVGWSEESMGTLGTRWGESGGGRGHLVLSSSEMVDPHS